MKISNPLITKDTVIAEFPTVFDGIIRPMDVTFI